MPPIKPWTLRLFIEDRRDDTRRRWNWHLQGANGEIIESGQGHVNRKYTVKILTLMMPWLVWDNMYAAHGLPPGRQ